MNLRNIEQVKALQSNLRATFDTPQGKEVMNFLETICSWYPNITDSMDTNEIIARDSNRRVLGTIKTLLTQKAETIVALAEIQEE